MVCDWEWCCCWQLISGVSIIAYWLSTFVFDVINYMVPCVMSIVLIALFDIEQLLTSGRLWATLLLFVFYGTSVAVRMADSARLVWLLDVLSGSRSRVVPHQCSRALAPPTLTSRPYNFCAMTQGFTYLLTYFFKSHSTAQTVVLLINLFCMILLIAAFIMEKIDATCEVNQGMEYLYRSVCWRCSCI